MAQPRILIIEDERGLTQSLSWFFKREGYEVTVADDGPRGAAQGPDRRSPTSSCSTSCCRG